MKRRIRLGLPFLTLAAGVAVLCTAWAPPAGAHCQVPCGIYDDAARIAQLREDAATITKAIDQILHLAGAHDAQAFNQAARWVTTKEAHATHIISTVSEYFLTQKVKPVAAGSEGHAAYLEKLADHHAVLAAAMKAKQQARPEAAAALDEAIEKLAGHYGERRRPPRAPHG